MGVGGNLNDVDRILNSAINYSGNYGEIKVFYSNGAAGPGSTVGHSERYIFDRLFIHIFDINALAIRPV